MILFRPHVVLWAIAASALAAGAQAQSRENRVPAPPPVEHTATPIAPREVSTPPLPHEPTRLRDVIRLGGAFELAAGDSAENITVIGGNAVVTGRVEHDVVVVFGDAQLDETAIVNGSLTVVGGNARIVENAVIRRDLAVVGGELEAPSAMTTRGDSFVLDTRAFGGRLRGIVDWCKRGLLWGRLFVPELGWMWAVIGAWFFLALIAATLLESPARQVAGVLRARPISACAVGIGTLVLVGPFCVLLAVSVIGALVVPFVLLTVLAGWVIGRVATARWIGSSFLSEGDEPSRINGTRSVVIGLVVIGVLYAFPVLGIAAWAGFGVFGLGGAMLTFINAYRRENPAPVASLAAPAAQPAPSLYVDRQEENAVATPASIPVPLSPSAVPPERRGQGLIAFPHARFLDRIAAAVLDLILILLIDAFLDKEIRFNVLFLTMLVYHVGFVAWKATTVGGIILQLRVVRTDGTPVRGADALVRGLASVFSVVVLGLGFLWIVRDPDRQAWHDRIAGTYVVKVPREWPI